MAYSFLGGDGESKNFWTTEKFYEINQQCRKIYFLQGIVWDIKYTPVFTYVYNGDCILQKKNIGGLEKNSGIIIICAIDWIFHLSSVGLIVFKKP
jgi:hypothetical protein